MVVVVTVYMRWASSRVNINVIFFQGSCASPNGIVGKGSSAEYKDRKVSIHVRRGTQLNPGEEF